MTELDIKCGILQVNRYFLLIDFTGLPLNVSRVVYKHGEREKELFYFPALLLEFNQFK